MLILGVTHPISLNNAACLINENGIIAMVEEERLNRVKHAPHMVPRLAIDYCLKQAGAQLADVDHIAVGFDRPLQAALPNLREPFPYGIYRTARLLKNTWRYERALSLDSVWNKVTFVNHHMAHVASSYYLSGFEEANILSLDGSGGGESGLLGYGKGAEVTIFEKISNAGSWGQLYEEVTELLGFRRHSGEGKTMGLAAYGTPDKKGFPFIDWSSPTPRIKFAQKRKFLATIVPRQKNDPLTDYHRNLAATLQYTLEQAGLAMVKYLLERTGSRRLCLAGGTALNCSMNGALLHSPYVDEIFIQPAAHDAGTALGAAVYILVQKTGRLPTFEFDHAYWGPEYGDQEIEEAIQSTGLTTFAKQDDIITVTASLLAQGKIVGWFQGRAEVGPRALCNRSILADPSDPTMKDKINKTIKHREPWRPFAPSIAVEDLADYVQDPAPSPFMILAFQTKPDKLKEIVSAIHVDDTCRPQSVDQHTNPRMWQLLQEFKAQTGIAALLNTSFNDNDEPIVCSPYDALKTFLASDIDYVVLGDYLVWKDNARS